MPPGRRHIAQRDRDRAIALARRVGVVAASTLTGIHRGTIARYIALDDARLARLGRPLDPLDHRTPEERDRDEEVAAIVDQWEALIAARWPDPLDHDRALGAIAYAIDTGEITDDRAIPAWIEALDLDAWHDARRAEWRKPRPLSPDVLELLDRADALLDEDSDG